MSGYNMHIFNDEYTRRKSNYIEDPKIANEIDDAKEIGRAHV